MIYKAQWNQSAIKTTENASVVPVMVALVVTNAYLGTSVTPIALPVIALLLAVCLPSVTILDVVLVCLTLVVSNAHHATPVITNIPNVSLVTVIHMVQLVFHATLRANANVPTTLIANNVTSVKRDSTTIQRARSATAILLE